VAAAPTCSSRREATIACIIDADPCSGRWKRGFSARETDVLELLADARSTRSIAETLHVSPKTVERHIANLATKLGVDGRTAVVAFAARTALGPTDGAAPRQWGRSGSGMGDAPMCRSLGRRRMRGPGTTRNRNQRRGITMQVIAVHDVDDVEHWFTLVGFFEAQA
jgi:DNA-binding CsgD family transcriptional regulator